MNIKNIITITLLTIIVASCGSTKEVNEDMAKGEVTNTENRNRGPKIKQGTELQNRPNKKAIDPEQLVAQLGLDEETEEKFLTIWEGSATKLKTIREESKDDKFAMRDKMKALREERQNGLKEILTKEQLAKLKQLTNRRMGKGRRGGKG